MREQSDMQKRGRWPFSIPLTLTIILIDIVLFSLAFGYWVNLPDTDFPTGAPITIEPGMSVSAITALLAEKNVVKSERFLYAVLVAKDYSTEIKASTYNFPEPLTTTEVAQRLVAGEFTNDLITITFPEGFSARDFYNFIPAEITETGVEMQIDVPSVEGYLFPDTYLVPASYSEQDVLTMLRTNFTEKTTALQDSIAASPYSLAEVVIFASLIEREANTPESMRLVAGILQNRLDIGMALQVDASVAYGLGKSGTELTREDLKVDGPYNTYTRPGLPIGPIANPGLAAIEAVLDPAPSEYLFYITGNDGNFYYAKTLDEHNLNVARYLR